MKAEFSLVIFLDIEIMKEYSNYVQCRIASTVNSVIMFRNFDIKKMFFFPFKRE